MYSKTIFSSSIQSILSPSFQFPISYKSPPPIIYFRNDLQRIKTFLDLFSPGFHFFSIFFISSLLLLFFQFLSSVYFFSFKRGYLLGQRISRRAFGVPPQFLLELALYLLHTSVCLGQHQRLRHQGLRKQETTTGYELAVRRTCLSRLLMSCT